MLRFLVIGIGGAYADLVGVGVFEWVGGGVVMHLSALMDSAFLPFGSMLMVAALCGVGENWMVQSWWGHGLDADGG